MKNYFRATLGASVPKSDEMKEAYKGNKVSAGEIFEGMTCHLSTLLY